MKIKMIPLAYLCMIMMLISGCGNRQQNAKEIEGTYTGTMPCADCSGIYTEITLADGKYTLKQVYQGVRSDMEDTFVESGNYSWDDNRKIVTLGDDPTDRYEAGNNELVALDMDGNKITGELAHLYVLKKR